jgi:uncharacterized protein YceK
MARTRTLAVLLVVVVPAFNGCGTAGNLSSCCSSGDWAVYGGVALDAKAAVKAVQDVVRPGDQSPFVAALAIVYYSAVDMPLSFVGDTLTLPITLQAALQRHADSPATVSADAGAEAVTGGSPGTP